MIGHIFAACLKDSSGLKAVYLPKGTPPSIAFDMAESINAVHPEKALVLSSSPNGRFKSVQTALQYRQDDRIAIVMDGHTDIPSFDQSFSEVLGLSYPEEQGEVLSLEAIAQAAVCVITGRAAGSESVRILSAIFERLMHLHMGLAGGLYSWNTRWFKHVDEGTTKLLRLWQAAVDAQPNLDVEKFIKNSASAAFALPVPTDKSSMWTARPGQFLDSLNDYWATKEDIERSVSQLCAREDLQDSNISALAELDLESFENKLAETDNALLAFADTISSLESLEAFSSISEDAFLDPSGIAAELGKLRLQTETGESLSVAPAASTAPTYLLEYVWEDGSSILESTDFQIVIPTQKPVMESDLEDSSLRVEVNISGVSWQGKFRVADPTKVIAEGRLIQSFTASGPRAKQRLHKLTIRFADSSILSTKMKNGADCTVNLFIRGSAGFFVAPLQTKKLGKLTYQGPTLLSPGNNQFEDDLDEPTAIELKSRRAKYRFIAWSTTDQSPTYAGQNFNSFAGRPDLYFLDASLRAEAELLLPDQNKHFLITTEIGKDASLSPVVAAIDTESAAFRKLNEDSLLSLRAQYETWILEELRSTDPSAFGHLALSESGQWDPAAIRINESVQLYMNPKLLKVWDSVSGESLSREFQNSRALKHFKTCFDELNICLSVAERVDSSDQISAGIVSTTSWKHLWQDPEKKKLLTGYLEAYVDLIEAASSTGNHFDRFWATYPFSASIWETSSTRLKCKAVLISPLHPLRLAWLAAVEAVLWEASPHTAKRLAGTIEGWNLPQVGPSAIEGGRFHAIPTESGEEQVFLGWSMLVPISGWGMDPEPLASPDRGLNLRTPGSAASGLNASSISAAFRNFRDLHPHISTLTIDLSASSRAPRMHEIDEAVLAESLNWANNERTPLRGGVRVFDSDFREGPIPRSSVTQASQAKGDLPISWQKYSTDVEGEIRSNIRILQDSGTRLQVRNTSSDDAFGLIAEIPLRRFEISFNHNDQRRGCSKPGIFEESGWKPFTRALLACEEGAFEISSDLFPNSLSSDNTDWTISGDSMLSPKALSELLIRNSSGQKMLWEWRPPFFGSEKDISALERRPFISIAKIPLGFQSRLKSLLEKAVGANSESSSGAVDLEQMTKSILTTLGTKGVGLSTMLTTGDNQAAGALGFALVFDLIERAAIDNDDPTFVLPIDACDGFLGALGDAKQNQRADLLILRILDDQLIVAPVEIKFYGLHSTQSSTSLPQTSTDARLRDPLKQALDSVKSLAAIRENQIGHLRNDDNADVALLNNGLAALVETALKLSPAESKHLPELRERVSKLASGHMPLVVGKPLIAYFQHKTEDGPYKFSSFDTAPIPFGLFAANSQATYRDLQSEDSPPAEVWRDAVEWSLEPDDVPQVFEKLQTEDERSTKDHMELDTRALITEKELEATPKPADVNDTKVETVAVREKANEDSLLERVTSSSSQFTNQEYSGAVDYATLGTTGGVHFKVGTDRFDQDVRFWPSNTALNQMNVGVVGDLGTGKTQLLMTLIHEIRNESERTQKKPISMLIFDYKEDFQSPDFLESINGTVLSLNDIPLNFFELDGERTPLSINQKSRSFIDILNKIYSGIGPVQSFQLDEVIKDLFNSGSTPTIADVYNRYREVQEKPDAVLSILSQFVDAEIFSRNAVDCQSFSEFIEGKVLVVALNQFGQDDDSRNALVTMFLNMYYEYMLKSKKWPFTGVDPQLRVLNSFLLVDEAVNIMKYDFPVLSNILLQGRQYGFGVILASQYLNHFKQKHSDYTEPLLTWFLHKVPNLTAKELDSLGIKQNQKYFADKVSSLKVHHVLYKSLDYPADLVTGLPYYKLQQSHDG